MPSQEFNDVHKSGYDDYGNATWFRTGTVNEDGTLDTSILPYEDCCTVFTPKHPKTKPVLAQVEAEEQKLDVEGLIARAIANTEKTQIRYYEDEHKG